MFNFLKKKEKKNEKPKSQNNFYGFYQDELENYIYEDKLDLSKYDLCLIEYRNSLKKYCIRKIGTNNERFIICSGDISKIKCDGVVNAARPSLLGGGGVDGAIHKMAGPGLLEECKTLDGCEFGGAKITKGHNMYVKNIIHAVGPMYKDGTKNEPEILKNAYINAMNLAVEHNLKTIALPAISCGNYGYPTKEGVRIAYDVTMEYLKNDPEMKIIFVVNNTVFNEFKRIIDQEV